MLDYFALILIIFVGLVLFYGIIVIHDIPYEIAKSRNHPQKDAIHVAGWISLFTLHVIWPFLWIWATLYQQEKGWGFKTEKCSKDIESLQTQIDVLNHHISGIEKNTSLQAQIDSLKSQIDSLKQKINQPTGYENKEPPPPEGGS